jgi:hypothetical protein
MRAAAARLREWSAEARRHAPLAVLWRALFWPALAVIVLCIKGRHVPESDEGLILEGAWNLYNHRELYLDSFQIVAPGAFYVVYWLWQAVGPGYASAQLLGIGCILLACLAIFRTSRLLGARAPLAYAGPLLYALASATWPAINHNAFSAAWLAWALYFALRAMDAGSPRDSACAGLCSGAAVVFMQNRGLAMLVALAGWHAVHYALARERRELALLCAYVAASLVPLLVLLHWPLPLLYESLVRFPLLHYTEVNRVAPWPLVVAAIYVVLAALATRNGDRKVTLLFIVQVALLATALQRTDLAHVLVVSFPLLALVPLVGAAMRRPMYRAGMRRYVYGGAAIALVAYVVSYASVHSYLVWRFGGLGRELTAFARTQCRSIYAGPFMPGMYFETRKLNPTSYPYLLTGLNTAKQFAQAARELARAAPQCVVANYRMADRFHYARDNPVDRYIAGHYRPYFARGGVTVYVSSAWPADGEGAQRHAR